VTAPRRTARGHDRDPRGQHNRLTRWVSFPLLSRGTLRGHPESTTGDIAKSLNADRGTIAAGLSHIARASNVIERDLP
jgi:hypothetical protein